MDQHAVDDNSPAGAVYNFYPPEQDPSYGMGYNPNMAGYGSLPHGSARSMSSFSLSPPTPLDLIIASPAQIVQDIHPNYLTMQQQHYTPNVFANSPPHGSLPLSNSPPPASPELYEALSPPLSGSDTSGDGLYHHSNSSGANSPSSSRGHSLVHRTNPRYNPPPSPTSSSSRHRRGRSHDSDDDDMGIAYVENLANTRKEATRRQRIEAEQRRRDELRDGYAKLKDALPSSNQKSSKVSLLERATNHIRALEDENQALQKRIAELELDSQRLRALNEKISLSTEGTPSPENALGRPISPPPDVVPTGHSLVSVRGQHLSSAHSSPSASEGGH
ncbi:hypothetical protein CVT25_014815 [Psilocybe cyanescens]|uniref:BHLH domain-containing protein n=1 Tax=Psilocybe cyanescens TaxID=93625 RepID=A0A409WEM6_PSICY|nr:hypothetical protein CVT25_014815 [Psilocybe cyanescens]